MPRRVRTRATRPASDLKPWIREFLEAGVLPAKDAPGREEIASAYFFDASGAALWRTWRETIMRDWIAEHPGSRPWGWWQHEAPPREERRKLSGSGEQTATFNLTRSPEFHTCDAGDPPKVESEAAFLKRLGVLEAGEEKRVPKRAWSPVRLKVEEGWAAA